jgi:uncharacterized membrane protein
MMALRCYILLVKGKYGNIYITNGPAYDSLAMATSDISSTKMINLSICQNTNQLIRNEALPSCLSVVSMYVFSSTGVTVGC